MRVMGLLKADGSSEAGEFPSELRPIFEASDFPPDIFPPEAAAHEELVRAEMARNAARP